MDKDGGGVQETAGPVAGVAGLVRKRIAPTRVDAPAPTPPPQPPGSQIGGSNDDAGRGTGFQLPPWRRMRVDLLSNNTVLYLKLVKQAKREHAAAQRAQQAADAPLPSRPTGPSENAFASPPQRRNAFADVLRNLELRCMAGELDSDELESSEDEGEHSEERVEDAEGEGEEEDEGEGGSGPDGVEVEGGSEDGEAEEEGGGGDGDEEEEEGDEGEEGTGSGDDSGGADDAMQPGHKPPSIGVEASGAGAAGLPDAVEAPNANPAVGQVRKRKHGVIHERLHYEQDFIDDSDILGPRSDLRSFYDGFFINRGAIVTTARVASVAGAPGGSAAPLATAPKKRAGAGQPAPAVPAGDAAAHVVPVAGGKRAADGTSTVQLKPKKAKRAGATEGSEAAAGVSAAPTSLAAMAAMAGKAAQQPGPALGPPTDAAAAATQQPAAAAPQAPAPKRGPKQRALQGAETAVANLKAKLQAALPQVAGDGAAEGVAASGAPAARLKLAALRRQLQNLALCCYRDSSGAADWSTTFGRAAVDELLGEGRVAALDLAPGSDAHDLLVRDMVRAVQEALKEVQTRRTEMRTHVQEWSAAAAAARAAASPGSPPPPAPPLPGPALACLDKLVVASRRTCVGDDAGEHGRVLAEVASWDTTQALDVAFLEAGLEAARKSGKSGAAAKTVATEAVASDGPQGGTSSVKPRGRKPKVVALTPAALPNESRPATEAIAATDNSPVPIQPSAVIATGPTSDPSSPAAPAAVPRRRRGSAAAVDGQSHPYSTNLTTTTMSDEQEEAGKARAAEAVQRHGGDVTAFHADYEAIAAGMKGRVPSVVTRASFLAAVLLGPGGGTARDMESVMLQEGAPLVEGWGRGRTSNVIHHPITSLLNKAEVLNSRVILVGKKGAQKRFAWHGYPGVVPAPEEHVKREPGSTRGSRMATPVFSDSNTATASVPLSSSATESDVAGAVESGSQDDAGAEEAGSKLDADS